MTEVKIVEHYFQCDRHDCYEKMNADNTEGHLNFLDDADWTVLNKVFRGPDTVVFCPAHNPFDPPKEQPWMGSTPLCPICYKKGVKLVGPVEDPVCPECGWNNHGQGEPRR